jgi:hypothetical protein
MAVDRSWRWIAWLVLGIGALILAGGLALGWGSLRHVLYAERADGEISEIRRDGDMYAPVVRFRLPSGETQEVTDLGSGAPDFAVGDRVTILYMPQDPEDFRIDTFDRLGSRSFSSRCSLVSGCCSAPSPGRCRAKPTCSWSANGPLP